ncbi:hypothetical protein [Streptomyces atratus]
MNATLTIVFATAATSTTWIQTNLGKATEVNHEGQTWTVLLPGMGTDEASNATPTTPARQSLARRSCRRSLPA